MPVQEVSESPTPTDTESNGGTISPLHSYLGIDPDTGEFSRSSTPLAPAAGPNAAGTPDEAGDPEAAAERQLEAVRRAVEQLGRGDGGLGTLLGAGAESPLAETAGRLAAVSWLLLLAYPAGLILPELFGTRELSEDPTLDASDRRYFRRRRRRRVWLAACSAAAIGLLAWGQWHWFWVTEPAKLTAVGVAIAALLLACVTLQSLLRRAAADYPAAVLRGVRTRQDEIARELADLRRRVAGTPS